jgi:acetyltransferase-like isoleucine patch superfamily enzyme
MANALEKIFYKISTKIASRLIQAGVFDGLKRTKTNLSGINISIGANCYIDPSAVLITPENGQIELKGSNNIGRNVELQPTKEGEIKIGFGTSIQDRNVILGDVEFGKYCLTAPNVYISSGQHYFDLNPNFYIKDQDNMVAASAELTKKHSQKVTIEDDVWIGINSVIMRGITIGRGSIIGSNSVVTKDVPPFSIMAGSPAKLIKTRLDFTPKMSISHLEDNDLPNFYKGFFLNKENLDKDRMSGGIAASGLFSTYLSDTGNKIRLTIKKLVKEPVTLHYVDQEVLLSSADFEEVAFSISKGNFHNFTADQLEYEGKLFLIKEIRILE